MGGVHIPVWSVAYDVEHVFCTCSGHCAINWRVQAVGYMVVPRVSMIRRDSKIQSVMIGAGGKAEWCR